MPEVGIKVWLMVYNGILLSSFAFAFIIFYFFTLIDKLIDQ